MLAVLRNGKFRRLYIAQVVTLIGTGLATLALALMAYDIAAERAGIVLGTSLAIKMVAYVLVAPLAQAICQSMSRRRIMMAAHLVRAGIAFVLPFVSEIWQIYLLVFVLQAASATYTPTFQSVIPDIVTDRDDYTAGLGLTRLASDLEQIVSPVIAGALLVLMESRDLFYATSLACCLGAILTSFTPIPQAKRMEKEGSLWSRSVRGIRIMVSVPALRMVMLLNMAVAAVVSIVLVASVVIVRDHLHLSSHSLTLILAINGCGSMTMACAIKGIIQRVETRKIMMIAAFLLSLCCLGIAITVGYMEAMPCYLALAFLWYVIGIGWSAVEIPVGQLIRSHVRSQDMPAVFAAQFSAQHACWLVCYPLAGFLSSYSLIALPIVMGTIGLAFTGFAHLYGRVTPSCRHIRAIYRGDD